MSTAVPLSDLVATLDLATPGDAVPTLYLAEVRTGSWWVVGCGGLDGLAGLVVPAAVDAVAVVTPASTAPPGTVEVRATVAVDRSGAVAGRIRRGELVGDDVPSGGRLLDMLRRSLGLGTPPPATGSGRLLVTLWLGAVLGACDGPAPVIVERLRWSEVLRLHPVGLLLAETGPVPTGAELSRLVEAAPRAWTWEVLRRACATGRGVATLCPPELAAWMDAGIFARWVLGGLPAPEVLLAAAEELVTPGAYRRLGDQVAAFPVGGADGTAVTGGISSSPA